MNGTSGSDAIRTDNSSARPGRLVSERAAAGDPADAESQFTLVYLSAADDPGLSLLPTHRLLERLEGKDYVVRDGEICHFRFNVAK